VSTFFDHAYDIEDQTARRTCALNISYSMCERRTRIVAVTRLQYPELVILQGPPTRSSVAYNGCPDAKNTQSLLLLRVLAEASPKLDQERVHRCVSLYAFETASHPSRELSSGSANILVVREPLAIGRFQASVHVFSNFLAELSRVFPTNFDYQRRKMDILQSLLSERAETGLLTGTSNLDAVHVSDSFPIDSQRASRGGGLQQVHETSRHDSLWEDSFPNPRMLISAPEFDLGPSRNGCQDSHGKQLSADTFKVEESDVVKPTDGILSFPDTLDADFDDPLCDFTLASTTHAVADFEQVEFLPGQEHERLQRTSFEKCHREMDGAGHPDAADPRLSKQEDTEADETAAHSLVGEKPRDKTTQRKLRNKESARRYREKQVAKRRQLEKFTRNLADQNQQLEMLHDKLLSLTCSHTAGRTGAHMSNGPLQDINN
jgi:hypothetical protein